MARYWKEKLDPQKYIDFIGHSQLGGAPVEPPRDNLIESWVYFVSVCSFTFQFQSLQQMEECLTYYAQKVHPSSTFPDVTLLAKLGAAGSSMAI